MNQLCSLKLAEDFPRRAALSSTVEFYSKVLLWSSTVEFHVSALRGPKYIASLGMGHHQEPPHIVSYQAIFSVGLFMKPRVIHIP